jgi:hypothetical protein
MASSPEQNSESNIGGISIRAIIVLFLIVVFAVAVFMKINSEALNSVVMAVIGWYFGQKSNGVNNNGGTTKTVEVPSSIETVQQ